VDWRSSERIRAALWAGILLVALVALSVGAWKLHQSRSLQLFGELVTFVPTQDSVVALTFDDGLSVPYTDLILDLLRRERVPATFFVIGTALERHPDLARRMVQDGHELGNHSYSHRRMVLVSPRTVRYEVAATDSLIRRASVHGASTFVRRTANGCSSCRGTCPARAARQYCGRWNRIPGCARAMA
jgi:peptidoglycan/xylan/chitin deacetylase (PgdA/CDA1 family)